MKGNENETFLQILFSYTCKREIDEMIEKFQASSKEGLRSLSFPVRQKQSRYTSAAEAARYTVEADVKITSKKKEDMKGKNWRP